MTPAALAAFEIDVSRDDDIEPIQAIYAHYVAHSPATFETEIPSVAQMQARRAELLRSGYPYLVARREGQVLGYAYAGPYRTRVGYRYTVEDSIYVADGCRGMGVGRALLEALIAQSAQRGYQRMVAIVGDSANAGSIALHAAAGFQHVGTLRSVGYKFGRWLDTVLMQRDLADPGASA